MLEVYHVAYGPRFPSLSGKTSIRTRRRVVSDQTSSCRVSIPFREDLYSDLAGTILIDSVEFEGFHPFQGRPLFGRKTPRQTRRMVLYWFPSLSGKTSIRTVFDSESAEGIALGRFPSLSGKTSIRTFAECDPASYFGKMFPSLSGKTSIRTNCRQFGFPSAL